MKTYEISHVQPSSDNLYSVTITIWPYLICDLNFDNPHDTLDISEIPHLITTYRHRLELHPDETLDLNAIIDYETDSTEDIQLVLTLEVQGYDRITSIIADIDERQLLDRPLDWDNIISPPHICHLCQ